MAILMIATDQTSNHTGSAMKISVRAIQLILCGGMWALGLGTKPTEGAQPDAQTEAVRALATEVRSQGWITFSARSGKGDWDLFLCRPDGSQRRALTSTPEYNEFSPLFSRDGRRMLFRRIPRQEAIDNNNHGTQGELVLANSDGTGAEVFGVPGEFPWASWSPDGRQIACLTIKGIVLVDIATKQFARRLDRKGFFQQVTWSPDGRWLVGVANSFGVSWSIARMNLATGEPEAVNRVDCCTPDWFPDSANVIFSWRPPGQPANNGYGWTQLWRADVEGKSRQLVYGEDGRHVYGGQVSPDGRYVLFTGNMEEDGDPAHAGGPMGLMRLADAPIIGGESRDLRAVHPNAKNGPVLTLPDGWEPCWTASELPGAQPERASADNPAQLARELHDQGWIAYSAKTEQGDWDLFLMRPDGTDRRHLTDTREFNEAGVRFSPDGQRLLYYRVPKGEAVDNNTYGTFDLVIADSTGGNAVVFGKGFGWASWAPDGKQLACLSQKGIQIVDVATRQIVRQLPRQGIVQQLIWSPDGRAFVGTANGLGPYWNIGRLGADSGILNAVSETDRYNCTPDWVADSRRIVYARGIIPSQGGRAELWVASADGRERHKLYAEPDRHIYGACASPDAKYLLFTRSVEDLGKVDNSNTTMAVIRWSERSEQESSPPGIPVRLDLGQGWEPHWTRADVGGTPGGKTP